MTERYDYIIIGSGSAGSALAYRLGEDGQRRILVLEFGGSDAGPLIQMPAALSYPMNMPHDWGYRAEAEPALGGRSLACPRGKVIGGSSSINGMIYVRGHAGDYAHWEESGAAGWGYAMSFPISGGWRHHMVARRPGAVLAVRFMSARPARQPASRRVRRCCRGGRLCRDNRL